jgi:hypothetical protein
MRRFALFLLLALHVIGLSGCESNSRQEHWITGPALVGDKRYVWLSGFIESRSPYDQESYWTLKIPKEELAKGFLQAFDCQSASRFPTAVVLLFLELDGERYTILSEGLLSGSRNGGPVLTYVYTDRNAFQSVKEFLLRYAPGALKPDVAGWRMSKADCA